MFAPKTVSRRRQRTSSGESTKPPSKRQRNILPQDDAGDEDDAGDLADLAPNPRSSPSPSRDIPIRTTKKPPKQSDEVNPVILSKTDFYTVSQLPCLPDQIRSLRSDNCRCYFASNHGYALIITQSEAIIWPYPSMVSSPSPTDVYRLPMPDSYRENSNVSPLGVILSTPTSSTPGLIIVMPHNGKIIYWETVSHTLLGSRKQAGLQGYIPGLLSGEYATDIVNGEPSGVIVTFSSGRVAHVTIRDSQGKPAVMASFLKNPSNTGGIGFFGGIKSVLGAGFWRKKVAAVRAGISYQRGQRDIIIATSAGLLEIWDTHWNNGSMFKNQFNIKEDLLAAINIDESIDYEVRVWDLAMGSSESDHEVSVLFGLFSGSVIQGVFVSRLRLSEHAQLLSTNSVDLHNFPADSADPQPRLFVPQHGETAFIVIGQSVILLSLTALASSDAVLIDNGFYSSINLRSGKAYEVLGMGSEYQNDCSSCLLMIREFGVVRITASSRQEIATVTTRPTAQHKLEQSVFYGTMLGNPLNLSSKEDLDFSVREIEEAALGICQGLLRSTSKFIPTGAISIDQNLKLRAKALDDLSRILLDHNKSLDRRIWWELLWGAEKLAAQRAIWRWHNQTNGPFLTHVLSEMSEKFRTKAVDSVDLLRRWFIFDTYRMEHILPWIFHATKPRKGHASNQMRRMSEQILEASELSLAVLETAFRYRDEHASQFGIGDGYLEEGVLITSFEGLPEFWTSQNISYSETGHLLDLELDSCRAIQQNSTGSDGSDQQIIAKIARNSARHLRVLGQMYTERIRWLSAQEDQSLLDEASAIKQSHFKQRRWQLFKLAGIGQLEEAMNLAEGFHDMSALVELIIELQDQKGVTLADLDTPDAVDLDRKITRYFEKFGESWADAFFARQISTGQSGILFSVKKFQPFVTQFLHKHRSYASLSWINDVIGEADYHCAAKTLEKLALEPEQDIWAHRVKVSLAKLAHLATWEKNDPPDTRPLQLDIRRLEGFAEMGAVQEVIYSFVSPVLRDAIDQKAEIDLVTDHFANSTAQDRPSLHELLKEALAGVVSRRMLSPDQLVDVLTLIGPSQHSAIGLSGFTGDEFHLALRVIQLGLNPQCDPTYSLALQKLVWRRCIIKDNWDVANTNESEPFRSTALFRTFELCLNGNPTNGFLM
ncbi:Non-repetitive/WGA-negative nucleoporin C-terminal-domain-containing protein [Aspergillus multicolor]|uniref:putative nuclear pore complex subunit Nup133 n=1 Tax=Aspergillus multicolor TaxID=41759 RepID=UPI003CCDBF2B